jgi:hypothetical protein
VLELFDNERDAVNSFFPERPLKRFEAPEYAPTEQ